MAVPAHDERDFAFATKYNLPITQSIAPLFGEIKDDEKAKISGYALVYNPRIDMYLLVGHNNLKDCSLPGGGIDDGEHIIT